MCEVCVGMGTYKSVKIDLLKRISKTGISLGKREFFLCDA